MSLANRLIKLRHQKRKSLQEVATALDVSKPHIWELEKGNSKNPSMDLLKKLSKYYDVRIDYLAGYDNNPNEQNSELMHFFRELEGQNPDPSDLEVLKAAAQALYDRKRKQSDT